MARIFCSLPLRLTAAHCRKYRGYKHVTPCKEGILGSDWFLIFETKFGTGVRCEKSLAETGFYSFHHRGSGRIWEIIS